MRLKSSEPRIPSIRKKNKYEAQFKQIFGVHILNYHHPFWGFDVIEFDKKFLIPKFRYPEGQSMSDCIRENFGAGAVDMIRDLIGAKEK